jgi:hypothetical protein
MPNTLQRSRYLPLALTIAISFVLLVLYTWLARWRGLPFSINPGNLLNVMSPLLLTSAFIERSVEVVIAPWRDAGATKLANALAALQALAPAPPQLNPAPVPPLPPGQPAPALPPDAPPVPATPAPPASTLAERIKVVSEELADYKAITQQYAFAVSITLSLAAAAVGVRTLWPLLDKTITPGFEQTTHAQQGAFLLIDVILTAALLAGGADGIHSVVNSFTTFFDTTAQKAQQSANTNP